MHAIATQEDEQFRPTILHLRFDTQNELQVFYDIFNYPPLAEYMRVKGFSPDVVRRAINALSTEDTDIVEGVVDAELRELFPLPRLGVKASPVRKRS